MGAPMILPNSPIPPPRSPQKGYLSKSPALLEDDPGQNRIRNQHRGTSLLSHAIRQNIGKRHTVEERQFAALEASRELDSNLRLPADGTIVIPQRLHVLLGQNMNISIPLIGKTHVCRTTDSSLKFALVSNASLTHSTSNAHT